MGDRKDICTTGGRRDRSIVLLRRGFRLNGWHGSEEALADLFTLVLRLDVPGEKKREDYWSIGPRVTINTENFIVVQR